MSQNLLADPSSAAAYERMVEQVFAYVPLRAAAPDPRWDVLACFETDGSCVAGIEIGELGLVLDGNESIAMAIRLAGVTPSHRGRGLFRGLMDRALQICDRRADAAPVLLYTEDAALYARFGFAPLAQHAFRGTPPAPGTCPVARRLDRAAAGDLIDRLAPGRAPVSRHCAVRGAVDLLRSNLDDEDLHFAFDEPSDALFVYEWDGTDLDVVDVVAPRIPTMAAIVGALAPRAQQVTTRFPPDLLAWDGAPIPDETGLMIRGRVPPAMRRPFMLPPTTAF